MPPFTIHPGTRADWAALAAHHYCSKNLGAVAAIWTALPPPTTHTPPFRRPCEARRSESLPAVPETPSPLAVLILSYPGLGCAARSPFLPKHMTTGPLATRATALNQSLRVIQRVAVHPSHQNRGIATALTLHALQHAHPNPAPPFDPPFFAPPFFVEAIARDGRFFTKAGMTCHGPVPLPRSLQKLAKLYSPADLADLCDQFSAPTPFRASLPPALREALRSHIESHHRALRGHVTARAISPQALAHLPALLRRITHPPNYFLWTGTAGFQPASPP